MISRFPDGLIDMSELGIASEVGTIDEDSNLYQLADLVIRTTGVIIRYAAGQNELTWTSENVPYEVRVIAVDFARRVFNNPQVQQRIQTGPLGESYSTNELTGLALKDNEEALLATFQPKEDTGLGSLNIIQSARPDPLGDPRDNRLLAPVSGMGRGDMRLSIPSLAKYLGVEDGL